MAELKRLPEFEWLRDADSQALQQSLKDLDRAYENFFKGRAEYPNFKRKYGKQSLRYPQRFKTDFPAKRIYLPKVGWVKCVFHRAIDGKMKNCTVSKTKSGKYFVSIQCEVEIDDPVPAGGQIGIDLGLKDFATPSEGEPIATPKHLRKSERRLKIRQRRLSRQQKGSNNRNKARHRVAVTHEKIANQRSDFHHQLSRKLIDENQVIGLETLNVVGMLSNHNLAKSISDAGWSSFVNMLAYKGAWYGCEIKRISQWFPSSKLCSGCGTKNQLLKLSDRAWTCQNCGVVHDRDRNAAINILNESTAGAAESNALGDTSSAVRHSAREAQLL